MKHRVRLSAFLIALSAGALTLSHDTPTAEARPTYTLYCRGGGRQDVTFRQLHKELSINSVYYLSKSKHRYSPTRFRSSKDRVDPTRAEKDQRGLVCNSASKS